MPISYIGITDFTNPVQVKRMASVWARHATARHASRRLHVGVMMSYKTLRGHPTKWSSAFPPKERIAEIFSASSATWNCLHYADYQGIDVYASLTKALSCGGPGLHALQLDMVWPNPEHIACARLTHAGGLDVILQIGTPAFHAVGDNPAILVERLREYGNTIQYVLLDKSMGRGVGMDARALLPFLRVIQAQIPHLGLAVAGGLGPYSMDLLDPLLPEFAHISIDAQSRLRPSKDALHPIDWNMAEAYLVRALEYLS